MQTRNHRHRRRPESLGEKTFPPHIRSFSSYCASCRCRPGCLELKRRQHGFQAFHDGLGGDSGFVRRQKSNETRMKKPTSSINDYSPFI